MCQINRLSVITIQLRFDILSLTVDLAQNSIPFRAKSIGKVYKLNYIKVGVNLGLLCMGFIAAYHA